MSQDSSAAAVPTPTAATPSSSNHNIPPTTKPTATKYDHLLPDIDTDAGLSTAQVTSLQHQWGRNAVPTPTVRPFAIFVRQFTGFLPLLIAAAAFVSLAVEDISDFIIILVILFLNACFGFYEELHAKKALDELSANLQSAVTVRRNGQSETVTVDALVPGDVVLLVPGTTVPADVRWLRGDRDMRLDAAALTGETKPRAFPGSRNDDENSSGDNDNDEALSGMTVLAGECYAQVVRTGLRTEMGRAHANVLRHKSVRVTSVFQQKIMRVVQWLLIFCVLVIFVVFLVQGLAYDGFSDNVKETILDALSIFIAAIPVALPLVLQINLALGAAYLARQHAAIVTSLPALQDIASMSMLCSDKTGTLTTAQMTVQREKVYSVDPDRYTTDDVLQYALLCSNADKQEDPIDRAICHAASTAGIATQGYQQTKIFGFSPTVKRVVAVCTTPDGQTLTVAKGLPEKIIDTSSGGNDDHVCQWKVERSEDKAFIDSVMAHDAALNEAGYKTIALAVCDGDARQPENAGKWKLLGLLPLLDPPRQDTPATIAALHRANISVQMITGDHASVGRETARLVGLGTKNFWQGTDLRQTTDPNTKKDMIFQADGFCTVLPSDKQEIVMTLRHSCGLVTGMTGDGVNDAPALSAAHVGIAVQGATDAAKNAADLILTKPGLSPIYGAVLESRRIFARMKSYVVYRVAASIALVMTLAMILFVTGCACDSLLIIILALVNDISMIPVAYDNASATTKPQLPRAKQLVLMSLYYGVMHTILALLFILSMLDLEALEDLEECDMPSRGFIWLYMILFTELMIFSVRAPSFFWLSCPSIWLVLSVFISCAICCVVAIYRNDLDTEDLGFLVVWNVAVLVVVDLGKVVFRNCIGDAPGDTIQDEILLTPDPKSEDELQKEKEARLAVHQQSALPSRDTAHNVEVTGYAGMFTDGIVLNSRRLGVLAKTGVIRTKKGRNKKATFKAPQVELA